MISLEKKINDYVVDITHDYDFMKLEEQWLLVQQDQDLPYFLTWAWISCWIKTYNPKIVVVSAKCQKKTVAIGLFTCSIENRHGFIKSTQYRLHQMGDFLQDQIWMEYNDFICVGEHKKYAVNACLDALQQRDSHWNEIILSMMAASRAKEVRNNLDNSYITLSSPCYSANLAKIRQTHKGYLSSLSSNTRYQIHRSIRLYQELHGDITFALAKTTEEAIEFFREAGKYHILRWEDSGYKNQQFIQFHENLIKQSFNNKSIDLMKIKSGDSIIGIIYFHLVNKNVFFYLHGLNYELNNKLKPGLVAHSVASQYYLDNGMQSYEYMGGYSQYKCQLASRSEDLVSVCIQRPSLSFYVEKIARKLKRIVRNPRYRRIK